MTKFAFDKSKKYKYDKTGSLVEATSVADDDIVISGSKSSLRRLAELERNVSILTTKTLTASSTSSYDSDDDNYDSIFDEPVRFKDDVSFYGADSVSFTQDSTSFGTSMRNAVRSAVNGYSQPAGTYNTIIGTDSDINTSGSTIIDNIYVTDGVITSMGTRTLTAGDLGAYTSAQTNTAITNAINNLVDGAPTALDTLNELANAIQSNDSDIASIIVDIPNNYVRKNSSQALRATDAIQVSNDTITLFKGDGTSESVTISDAYENYASWTLHTDGTNRGGITSGEVVNFVGGSNVSLGYSATNNTITINGTDTNTWRGVADNLTSTSTSTSLTANQGRVLKGLVDTAQATANSKDNYGKWNIAASGTSGSSAITSNNTVTFSGSGATTVTRSGDNIIISSTDTNTDTNTWRPVEDVLTSTSTSNSLSANQGRVLKNLIDSVTAGAVSSANKLSTARTIALSGDVSGSASFDGSANVTITATVADDSHNHVIGNINGLQTALNGKQKLTTIQTTAPSGSNGDLWWDSEDGLLNVYYNGTWVEASPAASSIAQGAGSGLDADTVDGIQASSFLRSDTSDTMSGNLSVTGSITASGDVTAYSDERLKDNIEVITNAGEKVAALRGVTFTRKSDGEASTGLIAQEVQSVLPEAVLEDEDGMLSVKYANMVGLLVEAVKELQAEVKALKGE